AGWAFLLDATTFVVSALLLMGVRAAGTAPEPAERGTLLAEMGEGFREVTSRPWLWVTVAVFALAVPLGYAPLFVLGPTVAKETYASAAVFGLVTASYGAGALAGGLIGFRWRPRHPMRAAFIVIAVWPLTVVAFAVGAPLLLVVPLALATGMGFALFYVFWNTTMAEQIPPHALSRASAYEWMGSLARAESLTGGGAGCPCCRSATSPPAPWRRRPPRRPCSSAVPSSPPSSW